MTPGQVVRRSLTYYWRTNLAVVVGVATAVAVLSGALLVGDSVRGSLRDLLLRRLGATDLVITSAGFFREALAVDVSAAELFMAHFTAAVPLIAVPGIVTQQDSGRRAGRVVVYGVDDRFWAFHGVPPVALGDREAALSPALAREIGAAPGAAILVRVQRPSDVPLESMHAVKEDLGRTIRLTTASVVEPSQMGEFSLAAQQGDIRAVFLPLERLRAELEVGPRVNTVLVSQRDQPVAEDAAEEGGPRAAAALESIVRQAASIEDVGLRVRSADNGQDLLVESETGLLDDRVAGAVTRTVAQLGGRAQPVLTYLANAMKVGQREIPYSLVTAMDLQIVQPGLPVTVDGTLPIVLNAWAADELRATVGDTLAMEYFVWEDPGQLVTRSALFRVAAVVPIVAGSRDLAPDYPGMSDSASIANWDPPFPVDLRRVRPADENYWNRYRTTPKAFVPLEVGQRLWRSRHGALTSVRTQTPAAVSASEATRQLAAGLRSAIDPIAMGLAVRDTRHDGVDASQGATDFGEYFIYFSFFLVVSALLLVSLFFKLGIEQRAREVGLLRAVGFSPRAVRRLFLLEGTSLALVGSALGVFGGIGYAALMMLALRTWWVDAVGTTALELHVAWPSLAGGAVGGVTAAVACIWWTLRSLRAVSERSLLAGDVAGPRAAPHRQRSAVVAALVLAALGVALAGASLVGVVPPAGGFFGAGAGLLAAAMSVAGAVLRRPARSVVQGHGWRPLVRMAARGASHRPGRSVSAMSVIACATFILITVNAFRRDQAVTDTNRRSGTGGYAVMVESLLPIVHDPNSAAGREALNLFDLDPAVAIEPFRLLPGDDASCLNLYQPKNPRILAPHDRFLEAGRFTFQNALATSDEERANPWLLLRRTESDGAIPVVADANSMTYVLHRKLGQDIEIVHAGKPIRLRLVGALSDSIFQSELLMSQANFLALFPEQEGFRFLLVDTPGGGGERAATVIENALRDAGADARTPAEHLLSFHRVENAYLSTFQTLGGLGLLLGTVGLATVLWRNMLERRREMALLAAVGYRRGHLLTMAAMENALLVLGGLTAGAVCASIAVAPAVVERGGRLPLSSGALLLLTAAVVVAVLSSMAAMAAVMRAPLLASLRSE